jgi:hypothetical protein
MRNRHSKRNPFDSHFLSDEDKLKNAYEAAARLSKKAGVSLSQSPISNDVEGWYSPLNIVLQTVDPNTAESLMDVLTRGRGPFYKYAVSKIENDPDNFGNYSMEAGEVPGSWLEPRPIKMTQGRRTIEKTLRPVDLIFDEEFGYPTEDGGSLAAEALRLGITSESLVEDLNWGKRRKKRPALKKKSKRRKSRK